MKTALLVLALASASCTALATGPSWVGGGLAVSAPLKEEEEEAAAKAERDRIAREPTQVGAKHILIMHDKSRSKPDSVTRTRAEALKRAEECLAKIRAGASFEDMVKEYSDEPGGAERGGDLGVFERGQMVKGFADAAFALKVGQVSGIVETPFGFHIIKRTE